MSSRVRLPRYCVCFWSQSRPRWAPIPPTSRPGRSITWKVYRRLRMSAVGNSPPKNSDATHGPTNGTDEHDRVDDPQSGARQQVVGQRVPGDPLPQGEQQQAEADQVVELSRPPERAREEDPGEMDRDRAQEDRVPSSGGPGASAARPRPRTRGASPRRTPPRPAFRRAPGTTRGRSPPGHRGCRRRS